MKALLFGLALASLASTGSAQDVEPWPAPEPGPEIARYLEFRHDNYDEASVDGEIDLIGGVRTGRGELFSVDDPTQQVGTNHLACGNTSVEPNGEIMSQICSGSFRLADGSLFWLSTVTRDDRDKRRINFIVTGGTGAYAGARGYGLNRFHERPTWQHVYLLSVDPIDEIEQNVDGS